MSDDPVLLSLCTCHNLKLPYSWDCVVIYGLSPSRDGKLHVSRALGSPSLAALLVPTVVPGTQQGLNKHVLNEWMASVEIELIGLDKPLMQNRWEAQRDAARRVSNLLPEDCLTLRRMDWFLTYQFTSFCT